MWNLEKSWEKESVTPETAVAQIKSGDQVFIHGGAATPRRLLAALCKRGDLSGVKIYHLHTVNAGPLFDPECKGRLTSVSFFAGTDARRPIAEGRAEMIPVFLSDIPALFKNGKISLDVAMVQLSPPNRHGQCTLGTSVDAARSAVDSARIVIAEVNKKMPRTHGNSAVPFSRLKQFVQTQDALIEEPLSPETPTEAAIGENIAGLIEDRSTLQLGIGGIPGAVARRLIHKRDLGIHTEMFSDSVVDLVEAGVITNKYKTIHTGRITTSFVIGSRRVFDFVDDNPTVEFHGCDRTNDSALIRQNDRVVAINSAIEVDLTGQVCADSIGHQIYSGFGGQVDFIHGAALSKGGKPIIALPSTAAGGKISRIVMTLKPGAGVVTTRGHVHWVVTEYGAINLHGLTLRKRAEGLISIAHPDFRGELQRELTQIRHF